MNYVYVHVLSPEWQSDGTEASNKSSETVEKLKYLGKAEINQNDMRH